MSDETTSDRLREAEAQIVWLRKKIAEQQMQSQIDILELNTKYMRLKYLGCGDESGPCAFGAAHWRRHEVQ